MNKYSEELKLKNKIFQIIWNCPHSPPQFYSRGNWGLERLSDILLKSKLMMQAEVGILLSVYCPDSYSTSKIVHVAQDGTLYDYVSNQ